MIKEAAHALDLDVSIFTSRNIKDYISEKYSARVVSAGVIDNTIQGMTYNSGAKRKLSQDKRILKRLDRGYYMLYIM